MLIYKVLYLIMLKTILLTVLALLAFAGNSVLCRLALSDGVIDAASFTSIRLFSGAIFLLFLVTIRTKKRVNIKAGNWLSAFFLFLYAAAFSYAYVTLDTGTGALILFGSVQVTMILSSLVKGKRLNHCNSLWYSNVRFRICNLVHRTFRVNRNTCCNNSISCANHCCARWCNFC